MNANFLGGQSSPTNSKHQKSKIVPSRSRNFNVELQMKSSSIEALQNFSKSCRNIQGGGTGGTPDKLQLVKRNAK